MGRRGSSSSSSSLESTNYHHNTDLRLGLSIPSSDNSIPSESNWPVLKKALAAEDECMNNATFYVKVYMEGIPIGRKLDLLAHYGYHDLISTLDHMFNTNIIWAEMECENFDQCHVLTYEDKEGDWLIVGDVPWEMFLSSVKRLKITRAEI
ncbi:auxin-responsive protein IAA30-like [Mercurialis annua]|uniref:auxin-responsive protein IAA30-like n=1 Tax=Mercurialis annua TaxID=3986 RepID=UPI00215F75B5|nr:auxin-responsive protein IAA30-like [Mercurialis annua]